MRTIPQPVATWRAINDAVREKGLPSLMEHADRLEPQLKPHLIDRYLAAAQQGGLKPVLCLNKSDLTDAAELQPLIGLHSQLGVPVLLCSARTGFGIDRLREQLRGRSTVFSGQ